MSTMLLSETDEGTSLALRVNTEAEGSLALRASVDELVDAFFGGRSKATLRSYRDSLQDFQQFTDATDFNTASRILIGDGPFAANHLALRYKQDMLKRGLKSNTVNARLTALRSLVKLARILGLINWHLEVTNEKAVVYRDTRGPGVETMRKIMNLAKSDDRPLRKRDVAMLRLMYDLGLRRGCVVELDIEHVDWERGEVSLLLKGERDGERKLRTLPPKTQAALRDWLDVRGDSPGALFVNFDRRCQGGRLTEGSLYRIIRRYGERVGQRVRPHGIRHTSITTALDLTNGNVRKVARFSGHANHSTVHIYDDCRLDVAGELAKLVSESV